MLAWNKRPLASRIRPPATTGSAFLLISLKPVSLLP
jgi:hypothetical protein